MRLLYDVTFNGAPRSLPSAHNSPAGPSGFFRRGRRQTKKNRNDRETRFRMSANASIANVFVRRGTFDRSVFLEKYTESYWIKRCDLSQLR